MFRNSLFILLMAMPLILWQCSDSGTSTEDNQPGKIESVVVPDSIQIPPAGYFNAKKVTATVSDPDGLADIDSVYFYSIKPNGEAGNSGNPLLMVDNGKPFSIANSFEQAGDETAGDGIYTLTILIQNNNLPGRYYFTFYMRDKAGNRTGGIKDSIEVYR